MNNFERRGYLFANKKDTKYEGGAIAMILGDRNEEIEVIIIQIPHSIGKRQENNVLTFLARFHPSVKPSRSSFSKLISPRQTKV